MLRREHGERVIPQFIPEPVRHRADETLLPMRQNRAGQEVDQSFLQQPLLAKPSHLHVRRNRRRELEQLMIEEGNPDLERVAHTQPIGERQDVIAQIGLDVAIEHAIEWIFSLRLSIAREKMVLGRHHRVVIPSPARTEQPLPIVGRDLRRHAKISARIVARRRSDKALHVVHPGAAGPGLRQPAHGRVEQV